MKKLNILHLSNAYGVKNGGGIHEVVHNFYQYQKNNMHKPSIWHASEDNLIDSKKHDPSILSLPKYNIGKFSILKCLFEKESNELENFNIIHQHGIWTPISLYSKKISKRNGLKAVVQPHGFLEPYRLNISKYKKKLAYMLFEKSNLSNCASLIACSDDECLKLKKMFPKQNVAIIYNGIDSNFFNAPSMKKNDLDDKKKILFLSQIIPVKGIERLLFAISRVDQSMIKDAEFLIAGYGEEKYINYLKNISQKLRIQHIVKFCGSKFGEEKIKLFDNSDFFILPTFSENYGIVVAESLARGLPVITTEGAPWSELNTSNAGLWVENSEKGIHEALIKMLQTPKSDLIRMGTNGRKLIQEKYLWEKTSVRTIELYNWILYGGTKPDFVY